MTRALALAILCGAVLAGCAVPRWVPFLGTKPRGSVALPVEPGNHRLPERRLAPADDSVVDRIVAVVNNDAITLGELLEAIAIYRQENRQAATATDEELAQQFLSRLIETRLQLQEADREKIGIDDAELEEEMAELAKRVGAPDLEAFTAMVQAQGVDLEMIRKRTRERLRLSKVVRRKVAQRVTVTEAEVDQYLAANRAKLETGLTYHARHILIIPDGSSEAAWTEAGERAEALYRELAAGADFAALARQHSGDATAPDGGDLGTLKRGELAAEIEAQIVGLEPGGVSRPFRSQLGWHLFRLESKETLEGEALARVRQQVREILLREKYDVRLAAWMKELKRRAIIDIRM